MPTHCPAFLCRAIALPNKAMLLSAIALRYTTLPPHYSSLLLFSIPRRFNSQPFQRASSPYSSSAIQSRAPPLQTTVRHCGAFAQLVFAVARQCFTLPWRSDSLPCPGTALFCHAIPRPSASGHYFAFLMLCRPPAVHWFSASPLKTPRRGRWTYRRGRGFHSRKLPPM